MDATHNAALSIRGTERFYRCHPRARKSRTTGITLLCLSSLALMLFNTGNRVRCS